jgi:hypothetical protein
VHEVIYKKEDNLIDEEVRVINKKRTFSSLPLRYPFASSPYKKLQSMIRLTFANRLFVFFHKKRDLERRGNGEVTERMSKGTQDQANFKSLNFGFQPQKKRASDIGCSFGY